jgi:hypothetical protein
MDHLLWWKVSMTAPTSAMLALALALAQAMAEAERKEAEIFVIVRPHSCAAVRE